MTHLGIAFGFQIEERPRRDRENGEQNVTRLWSHRQHGKYQERKAKPDFKIVQLSKRVTVIDFIYVIHVSC